MITLQDVSSVSSIFFDVIILAPFFSKKVRRYLFKAMVLDILYEILSDGQELENQIRMLKNVITVYNQIRQQENPVIKKEEKND